MSGLERRAFLGGIAGAALVLTLQRGARATEPAVEAKAQLEKLEQRSGGRLGVYATDALGQVLLTYRAGELFPMCSTFKVLAVAAILARVQTGSLHLGQRVSYSKDDVLEYAPIASKHVADGYMTVQELCSAAIEFSDNTAANLLLGLMEGPKAVTEYARSLGDPVTRLDRTEPTLNTAIPGDPRDTTSPAAMTDDLRKLLFDGALSTASSELLGGWMRDCQTGTDALRAGFPKEWTVGDKTGSGKNGTHNDVAFAVPASGKPVFVAAYLTGATVDQDARSATLASVARLL